MREVDAPGHPEEKTGQNNELLDLIVNGFNGFIYTVSTDYKVEFINDALMDCGGIPDTLIESEFFGYRKGAFTGMLS